MSALERLALNQATVKRASLPEAVELCTRNGIGARYGASVSTKSRSNGISRAMARRSSAVLKVTMPESEI